MGNGTQHLHKNRPTIGQRVTVTIFNFTGREKITGTYSEDAGQPMVDGIKLHPLRTEWTAT